MAEAAEALTRYLHGDEVVTATDDGRLVLRLRHEDRGARPVRLQEMAYHAIEAFDRLGFHTGVIDLGVGWAPITRKRDPELAAGVRRRGGPRVGPPARPPAPGLGRRRGDALAARSACGRSATRCCSPPSAASCCRSCGLVGAYLLGVDLSGAALLGAGRRAARSPR